jgi:hypothetical protein
MNRFLSALVLLLGASFASFALAAEPPLRLADNAPARHIVVPGDTLWAISARFLKDPWRWPELWRMNREQVKNPHRIYPGDVLVVERDSDGTPHLRLERVHTEPRIYSTRLREEIPSIPPNVINPFLSAPLVIEDGELDQAPRIVATQQDRVFLATGDLAYVEGAAADVDMWQIYRRGRPLTDPETRATLGFEAFYLGTARQLEPGSPAIFEIVTFKEEIGRGDRLLPATPPPLLSYVPHKPESAIDGRVISIYGGVNEAGRFSIIALNRGRNDGLEIGHVLSLQRNRIVSQRDDEGRKERVKVPEERYGLAFVFRVFDRISYALVVQSNGPVTVNDFLRTP